MKIRWMERGRLDEDDDDDGRQDGALDLPLPTRREKKDKKGRGEKLAE